MSHFSQHGINILYLDCLMIALKKMGLELTEHCNCRAYGGQIRQFPYGIKLTAPAKYDVGLECTNGTGYHLSYDSYAPGGVEKIIGRNGENIFNAYAEELLRKKAEEMKLKVYGKSGSKNFKVCVPNNLTQYLECIIEKGKISFTACGFSGKECMKFQGFEEAFGMREKMHMYASSGVETTAKTKIAQKI